MARARNIKPGFFKNADLVELPFEYRLLFIGLWTLADREGRLEDRPKQIRMELFPADDVNCDKGLTALEKHGFVLRYRVDGNGFVQVVNFGKHQNPHVKEAKSTIPAPEIVPELDDESTVQAPENERDITAISSGASTVQERTKDGASRADVLIPDSGSLIPDSLIPDSEESSSSQEDRPRDEGRSLTTISAFATPEPSPPISPPDPTRAGLLSKKLRDQGILSAPGNAILLGWMADGYSDEDIMYAVEKARIYKPRPDQIPLRYLDPIVRESRAKPRGNGSHGLSAQDRLEAHNRAVADAWEPPEDRHAVG